MLSKIVRIAVDMTVHEGRMGAFKALAEAMSAGSASEPGTLGYEWFIGEDGRSCRLLETYADAAAVTTHLSGPVVRELFPQITALCSIDRFEIYGEPEPQVRESATGIGAKIYPYWLGINR